MPRQISNTWKAPFSVTSPINIRIFVTSHSRYQIQFIVVVRIKRCVRGKPRIGLKKPIKQRGSRRGRRSRLVPDRRKIWQKQRREQRSIRRRSPTHSLPGCRHPPFSGGQLRAASLFPNPLTPDAILLIYLIYCSRAVSYFKKNGQCCLIFTAEYDIV